MPDLRRARADLHTFAAMIEWPLTRWQSAALCLHKRTTVIVAPRQSGKSRSLAVCALHWAYSRPEQRVLVVSAGEDASKRLLAEAAAVAIASPLLAGSLTDENAGLLTLSNGSEVRSVPASEKAIRGWAVDLLLCDESVQIEPDLLLSACLPTVAARPDGRIVLASSPGPPEGPFYDFATSESGGVAVAHWALADATWIEPEVIEQAREQLPPDAFAREFEGRFTDAGDETIIPREWIEAAQRRTLAPTESVVFGVDLARGGDESVCVRLDGGHARVVWANRDPDLMRVADRLAASLRAEVIPPLTFLDAAGLGYGVLDRCRDLGVEVAPFLAAGRAPDPARHLNLRSAAWFTAREAFRLGTIDLDPADKLLASQLAAQKFQIAASGALQVASKDSMPKSPDRADALVIALHARAQKSAADTFGRFVERLRSARPHERPSTEAAFGDAYVPTELAWGGGETRERIVPDSAYRNSKGGRHKEW